MVWCRVEREEKSFAAHFVHLFVQEAIDPVQVIADYFAKTYVS